MASNTNMYHRVSGNNKENNKLIDNSHRNFQISSSPPSDHHQSYSRQQRNSHPIRSSILTITSPAKLNSLDNRIHKNNDGGSGAGLNKKLAHNTSLSLNNGKIGRTGNTTCYLSDKLALSLSERQNINKNKKTIEAPKKVLNGTHSHSKSPQITNIPFLKREASVSSLSIPQPPPLRRAISSVASGRNTSIGLALPVSIKNHGSYNCLSNNGAAITNNDNNNNNNNDNNNNNNNNNNREDFWKSDDRFIPNKYNTPKNSKNDISIISDDSPSPPPNASPETHLRAHSKKIFKSNVANACGIDFNQRILQYLPEPPIPSLKRSQSYQIGTRYNYFANHITTATNNASITGGNLSNTKQQQQQQQQQQLFTLRKVNKSPERILDAPNFVNDFYLNLISWNNANILAIALDTTLYLWNGNTGDVTQLVDYDLNNDTEVGVAVSPHSITSVTWADDNCHISIGKKNGDCEIWDVETMTKVRTMHSNLGVRIGSQSWFVNLVAMGFKSGEILINDVRIKNHVVSTWEEHQGEVCGLSYRRDGLQLASGGNDNTVCIWDSRTSIPQHIKRQHQAAVKAISWNPDILSLLATGGGTNDRKVHFWNTTTGARVNTIDTGSQVSSIQWGQSYAIGGSADGSSAFDNRNGVTGSGVGNDLTYTTDSAVTSSGYQREIVVTGGHPNNAISIYNYETRFKVAEIDHAHEARIVSSQLSPDGTTLVTVGGDENLKFHKIFDVKKKKKYSDDEMLACENTSFVISDEDDESSTKKCHATRNHMLHKSVSSTTTKLLRSPHKNNKTMMTIR
ncbi:ubiquitin-protein transferase activating protein CDC20 SCDLUD_001010 [Saccharomycodes ludwigii]|uniref:ubiquitin-protein transferase activating protein CDC20 n=1 Tax=Saccharomycodes ludwigii TaxID=36035 RepID=UPI001E83375E|nr:hypothetical protein SCDLUD_001010 [Saccharomycodes ludwigii]KAH3903378.1 hypothetical protein SCDLUD_001010 [Saccharomycodes ludwigii]